MTTPSRGTALFTAAMWRRLSASEFRRNAGWMTYAYLLSLALQALYFVIVARTLRSGGFGAFASALAFVSVASPFAGLGSGNVLVLRSARNPDAFADALGKAVATLAATGIALLLALWLVSGVIFQTAEIRDLVFPLALSELFCARIVELCAQCFQAKERLRSTAQLTVSTAAFRMCAVLAFLVLPGAATPVRWSWLYLAASAGAALLAATVTVVSLDHPVFRRAMVGRHLKMGVFFSIGQASKTLYGDIDKVMLADLASVATAGFYTAAYRILTLAFAPLRALVFSANTRLYRAGVDGPRAVSGLVRRMLRPTVAYSVVAGVALLAFAPLLPLLLGASYRDSVNVLRLLAVMPLIQGVHYLYGDALMGLGRQSYRSLLQLGTAILNVGLNLVWIPRWSWAGATFATILSEGFLAVASVIMLRRMARNAHD